MAEEPKGMFRTADLIMGGILLMVISVLILPIPTFLLDLLLVLSISMGVLILMLTTQIRDALQLSSFPSLLLILTLFRLSLNVATTRQILLNGFAGNVVQAFGDFVVGGNYVVGIVVFLVLVTINFMVITKGSGRVAEVAARFTLDAMPGKQMSIDADLNSGIIDEKQAVERREKLASEAEFYGAMDGASKFVRGDAVAGLVITVINIAGGFAIGVWQQGRTAADALSTYTILTVGDGLVAQIPALVISTAAGMLVTRVAASGSLGSDVGGQLFRRARPLLMTGAILGVMGLVPGLPLLPFAALGASLAGVGWFAQNVNLDDGKQGKAVPGGATKAVEGGKDGETKALPAPGVKHIPEVSPVDLEIGFGLVPMVDQKRGGKLIDKIGAIRTQIAEELGFLLPPVNVRDNVNLKNTEYAINVRGVRVAGGNVKPGSLMAINPGGADPLDGIKPVREPAFGFEAYWISDSMRDVAEAKGMTVVDGVSVITTHLAEQTKTHAASILTRQSVSDMVDRLKESQPSVIEELLPTNFTVGGVHRILCGLLKERVPIRDLGLILETIADNINRTKDTGLLVELVRRSLGPQIVQQYMGPDGRLPAIGLQPELETVVSQGVQRDANSLGTLALDPSLAQQVVEQIAEAVRMARDEGVEPILLCSPVLRPHIRRMIAHEMPTVATLSFIEVPDSVAVNVMGMAEASPMLKAVLQGEENAA